MSFALRYLEQVPFDLLADKPEEQVSAEEITARVGKYLVMESLRLPFTDKTKVKIARGDVTDYPDFTAAVTRKWTEKFPDLHGFEPADLEIEADILGVFEDIWPQDADIETPADNQSYANSL